jgi:hypothetical protein
MTMMTIAYRKRIDLNMLIMQFKIKYYNIKINPNQIILGMKGRVRDRKPYVSCVTGITRQR